VQSIADLSLIANSFCADKAFCILLLKQFLRAIDKYEIIVTDRLHIGICSMLLGKKVYMIDNSYKKLSNVYKKSMSDKKNVILVNSVEDLIKELNKLDFVRDNNQYKITEVTFDNFVYDWGGIKNNFGAEKVFWGD